MRILLLAACALLLAACGGGRMDNEGGSTGGRTLFHPFRSSSSAAATANQPQLGVNSYLWRATLDTLNFMPLASADPVGGVVISDWYAAPDKPDEHMKVTVYILDRRLRADAVKVSVFRQTRGATGWADAQINPDTGIKLENAILARARELRLSSTQ
jgi:ABC-type oligopeptide transport system substrate-binding subunit